MYGQTVTSFGKTVCLDLGNAQGRTFGRVRPRERARENRGDGFFPTSDGAVRQHVTDEKRGGRGDRVLLVRGGKDFCEQGE
jgi:hypothetical protein|tara:strand:+ start:881 stop:1123 length:243 start_codon:yes stop_codon:yes gene_type:complete